MPFPLPKREGKRLVIEKSAVFERQRFLGPFFTAVRALFFDVSLPPPDNAVNKGDDSDQDDKAAPMFLNAEQIMTEPHFD